MVEMTIGTLRTYDATTGFIVSPPKRFGNVALEIVRRIGGDKVRFLKMHVEMTKNFFSKSREILTLAVNLVELGIDFKNWCGLDVNFVAALPSIQLPSLKKLRLSTDEVNEEGEEGIRILLRRIFAISQNLESFEGSGINNGVCHMIAELFFEELEKIPGRPEMMKELLFTPHYFHVTPVFERIQGNLGALRSLTLNIDDMNSAEGEGILKYFKKSLSKLVINLGRIFDEENDHGRVLNIPVMPNLVELELYKSYGIGVTVIGVVIEAPSDGVVFGKLGYLEISVALMRDMILLDAHTTPARFPVLARICFDEREEEPGDEMMDRVWNLFQKREFPGSRKVQIYVLANC
ncbi:uncharacterized protein LOC118433252 [Folsomia candida]|nr:uncharacterized protein LOC118433252 [Folsomia candida]XP_035700886.1 uncharacterized protein LOC118433252 [Folsomia candida]XP_035700887.1 uncharacterized protein LOC118433252 [Folsomia candida]